MEKINEEVAVIMQRVRAERAMNAESAKKPEASGGPSATPRRRKRRRESTPRRKRRASRRRNRCLTIRLR